MLPLARRTAVRLRLRTRLYRLRVHFNGRSLICPTSNCAMCQYERPRLRYYAIADLHRDTGLLELPPTLADRIEAITHVANKLYPVGLVLELDRNKTRAPWKIMEHTWSPIEEDNELEAVSAAAILFKVNVPDTVDDWPSFRDEAGRAHAGILRNGTIDYAEPAET